MRPRWTVGRLLVLVGAVGLTLGAARVHPALSFFAGGVSALALIRTYGELDRLRTQGITPARGWTACLVLGSLLRCSVLLAIPPWLSLVVYNILDPTARRAHRQHTEVSVAGLLVSVPLAVWVAASLRRRLWPVAEDDPPHPTT